MVLIFYGPARFRHTLKFFPRLQSSKNDGDHGRSYEGSHGSIPLLPYEGPSPVYASKVLRAIDHNLTPFNFEVHNGLSITEESIILKIRDGDVEDLHTLPYSSCGFSESGNVAFCAVNIFEIRVTLARMR